MKICLASSEFAPLAKTGGLADVTAGLSSALIDHGQDVRAFLPLYESIDVSGLEMHRVDFLRDVPIQMGPHTHAFSVFAARPQGSSVWLNLIDCPALYRRAGVYTSDGDEHVRFAFFCRAVIESCQRMGWGPDIVHCNDWHTALLPLYLKTLYAWDDLFSHTKTVLTIHNIGYQGVFGADVIDSLGLGEHTREFHNEDLGAGRVNFIKTGILHADVLTTVSETYAQEIQTAEFGVGLEDLLRARWDHLVGIVNGVDYGAWDPQHDPHLPHHYSADNLEGKTLNKEHLLRKLDMNVDLDTPLLGIVSRLTYQKGFDLAMHALPAVIGGGGAQLVALGSGEPKYESFFQHLQDSFPGRVVYHRGYHNELAHLIEASADMFLMPSLYEPCGLNQMYSLRYGTPPIVRKTGGLADTVQLYAPWSGEGTGFVFEHFTPEAFAWALQFALETYQDSEAWKQVITNGMAQDFSWRRHSRLYLELYANLMKGH